MLSSLFFPYYCKFFHVPFFVLSFYFMPKMQTLEKKINQFWFYDGKRTSAFWDERRAHFLPFSDIKRFHAWHVLPLHLTFRQYGQKAFGSSEKLLSQSCVSRRGKEIMRTNIEAIISCFLLLLFFTMSNALVCPPESERDAPKNLKEGKCQGGLFRSLSSCLFT